MSLPTPSATLDVQTIRRDFPILDRTMHGKPLVYLDSAATSQKPQAVIDALVSYYQHSNANVHRGVSGRVLSATPRPLRELRSSDFDQV